MIKIYDDVFHLTDGKFSYAFFVRGGKLIHSYFGRAVKCDETSLAGSVIADGKNENTGADAALFEFPEQGRCDFRAPCIAAETDKTISTDFRYKGYEILSSKPDFGMPALRYGGETLAVRLYDDVLGAELSLYYTVYDGGLARRAELKNCSKEPVRLNKFLSACADFPQGNYDLINICGRWGAEFNPVRSAATQGVKTFCSSRGVTSHQHNPFVCAVKPDTSEEAGDAYGFNLIYSGNFTVECELDEKSQLRINLGATLGGIVLQPSEVFSTPEAVLVYSHGGIGGMSRKFHALFNNYLINPAFANKPRPVVLNSWESCYFDFDEKKLFKFIDDAGNLGIDMIVLDDGWFGKRNSDTCSLGDWFVNRQKLPSGLKAVSERCKARGMQFGIWFEPEAISPVSELFKKHPEWALHVEGREGAQMRNQLALDFSLSEVVDYIYGAMAEIIEECSPAYIKWDMNRPLSDISSPHKYVGFVKGMYSLYERLTENYPQVLIEGCSSGGGRFDAGILYYSPLIWTSDDTDAYRRAKIQYGASLVYPLQTLSNHVSVCPNHQTGRTLPFKTRGAVASLGCLGYELDVGKLTKEEREQVKEQIKDYKKSAALILKGDLFRLASPYEGGGAFCEEVVSKDKSQAYVVYVRGLVEPNLPLPRIHLRGLEENALYRVEERGAQVFGSDLMYGGLRPQPECCDFGAEILHITKIA